MCGWCDENGDTILQHGERERGGKRGTDVGWTIDRGRVREGWREEKERRKLDRVWKSIGKWDVEEMKIE